MGDFTKAEKLAIDTAFRALESLCDRTNWSDAPRLREILKLERKETQDITVAKAIAVKQWADGHDNPETPASSLCYTRQGALMAFLMGVEHRKDRAKSNSCGPYVAKARAMADAAIYSNDAHTARIVASMKG